MHLLRAAAALVTLFADLVEGRIQPTDRSGAGAWRRQNWAPVWDFDWTSDWPLWEGVNQGRALRVGGSGRGQRGVTGCAATSGRRAPFVLRGCRWAATATGPARQSRAKGRTLPYLIASTTSVACPRTNMAATEPSNAALHHQPTRQSHAPTAAHPMRASDSSTVASMCRALSNRVSWKISSALARMPQRRSSPAFLQIWKCKLTIFPTMPEDKK